MSHASMGLDLLQPFQIVTEFGIEIVGKDLEVLAINDIFLSVQEPCWNLELRGVLDNGDDAFEFVGVEITSAGWWRMISKTM